MSVTDRSLDELGPVDYVVVEFPAGASNFTGEMAGELLALVDAGTIRVIDALILTKDQDGGVEATELSEIAELGAAGSRGAVGGAVGRGRRRASRRRDGAGSTAGVLIWETCGRRRSLPRRGVQAAS